jgi:hypothetical protein
LCLRINGLFYFFQVCQGIDLHGDSSGQCRLGLPAGERCALASAVLEAGILLRGRATSGRSLTDMVANFLQ